MKPLLYLSLFLGTAAWAENPMTAAEFQAYTEGHTFHFKENDRIYGAERYKADRYVEWSFLDGICVSGRWHDAGGGFVCFVYDEAPDNPQCWKFYQTDHGIRAEFKGDPSKTVLYEAQRTQEPMSCIGPDVGA